MSPEQQQNIVKVIDQLNRLSVAIRRSGNRMRYEKADRCLQMDKYADFHDSLNFLFALKVLKSSEEGRTILRSKPPTNFDEPTDSFSMQGMLTLRRRLVHPVLLSIQERLIDLNIKRRHRIIYAKDHSSRIATERKTQSTVPAELGQRMQFARKESSQVRQAEAQDSFIGAIVERPQDQCKETLAATSATGVGSQLAGIPQPQSSLAPTQVTATGSMVEFPRPPNIRQDASIFQCPFCCITLDEKYSKKARWR